MFRPLALAAALALTIAACSDSTTGEQGEAAPATPIEVPTSAGTTIGATGGMSTVDETEADDPDVLVVRGGTLIDGTGAAPLSDGVIVVAGGRITGVGPAAEIPIPDGAEVIDARGGTILPGMIDTHTHHLNRLRFEGGDLVGFRVDLALTKQLEAGITAYRDAGSGYGGSQSMADLRAAIGRLEDPVPTIVATGPIIAIEGNQVVVNFPDQAIGVADAPAAAAAVNRFLDNGVDQIKIMVEHWEFTARPTPSLTPEQLDALIGAAHERGAWVLAHVSDIEEARMALAHGADELTHWPGSERLPDDLIEELAAGNVPVGTTFSLIPPFPGDVRRLLDAGGTVLLSSDAPGAMSAARIWQELDRMVQAGMTPMEAILASTRDAAAALGLGEQLGTLTVGKIADIIVVDGDPLEDIESIGEISVVIKAGRPAVVGN